MRVLIPSALRSYTDAAWTETGGDTPAEVLAELEARYPGIRFRMVDEQNRIRPHIRLFFNGTQVRDLSQPLEGAGELLIVQALSGG